MEPTFDMPERQLSRRCEKCNNQKLVSDLGAQKSADATLLAIRPHQLRTRSVVGYGILPIVVALQHRRRESTLL